MLKSPDNTDINPTFTQHVRGLVKDRPASLTLVELAAKCDCSVQWLSNFANDDDDQRDPGVKKIILLYEILSGKRLEY